MNVALISFSLQHAGSQELRLPWCHFCRSIRIRDVRFENGFTKTETESNRNNRTYDNVMDKVWDSFNKGVRSPDGKSSERWTNDGQRQWKDIRAKYIEAGGDDDE